MARPQIGTIIKLTGAKGEIQYLQSRPDTWANDALAREIDALLGEVQDEPVSWFDRGAAVLAKRKGIGRG